MRVRNGMIGLAGAVTLAACSGSPAPLYNLRSDTGGPDEFAILPTKPLEMPEDMAALPAPTPGGRNLVDPTPEADAIAALGGNAEVLTRGITDNGLIRYTTRYGVDPQIRAELAAADAQFRAENGPLLLERLANVSTYYDAYAVFELDQQGELLLFRQRGIPTPSSPPPPIDVE